jgi:ferredoxin
MSAEMSYVIAIANTAESYCCPVSQNLLAAMEALARKGIPVGCRGGGCGVCKVRIESGRVHTARMSRAALSAGEQAYPRSDLRLAAVDKLARCVERSAERSFLDAARAASSRH